MEEFESKLTGIVDYHSKEMTEARGKFESQPQFVRAGLYFTERLNEMLHQQPIQKYFACDLLKIQGNLKFKNYDFDQACMYYEQALSMFRYVRINRQDWKEGGFTDSDLEYIDENGRTDKEKKLVKGLKIILYQNICLVYLKLSKQKPQLIEDAILATSEAIKLDLKGSKAFYLRAKSRLSRINLINEDYKLSIKDLKKALEFCTEDNTFIAEELQRCQTKYNQFLKQDIHTNTSSKLSSDPISSVGSNSKKTNGHESNDKNNAESSKNNQEPFSSSECEKDKQKPESNSKKKNKKQRTQSVDDKKNQTSKISAFSADFNTENKNNNTNDNCEAREMRGELKFEKTQGKLFCNISFSINPQTKIPGEIRELEEYIEQLRRSLQNQLMEYEDVGEDCCKLNENNSIQDCDGHEIAVKNDLVSQLEYVQYTQEELYNLARMDLDKPTQQLQDLADIHGIDLKSPAILSQFQQLIEQNIEDIKQFILANFSCQDDFQHLQSNSNNTTNSNFYTNTTPDIQIQKNNQEDSTQEPICNSISVNNPLIDTASNIINDTSTSKNNNNDTTVYSENTIMTQNQEENVNQNTLYMTASEQYYSPTSILDHKELQHTQQQQLQDNSDYDIKKQGSKTQLNKIQEFEDITQQNQQEEQQQNKQQIIQDKDKDYNQDNDNESDDGENFDDESTQNGLNASNLLENLAREGTLLRELAFQLNSCGISNEEEISQILNRIRQIKYQIYGTQQEEEEGKFYNDQDYPNEEGEQFYADENGNYDEYSDDQAEEGEINNETGQDQQRQLKHKKEQQHLDNLKTTSSRSNSENTYTIEIISTIIVILSILGALFYKQILSFFSI